MPLWCCCCCCCCFCWCNKTRSVSITPVQSFCHSTRTHLATTSHLFSRLQPCGPPYPGPPFSDLPSLPCLPSPGITPIYTPFLSLDTTKVSCLLEYGSSVPGLPGKLDIPSTASSVYGGGRGGGGEADFRNTPLSVPCTAHSWRVARSQWATVAAAQAAATARPWSLCLAVTYGVVLQSQVGLIPCCNLQ